MPYITPAILLGFAASAVLAAAGLAQETQAPSMPADLARMAESARAAMGESAQSPEPVTANSLAARSRELPQYTASGELKLPTNWREWIFVGDPFTPNALNGGHAGFPEYHNVYIEPGSYDIYRKTGVFPDGTIFVKELQLTLGPAENPDGSRTEPSGRGYFPGAFNGADVTVKDTKRFADTGAGDTSISIIPNQRSRPPRCNQSRIAPLPYRRRQERRGVDAVLPHAGRSPAPPRCWREAAGAVTKQQEFGPVVSGYRTIGFRNRHDTG